MFEIFCHSGGKQAFLVTENGFFCDSMSASSSVAAVMEIVDGLCKGSF